ncbi:MAG: hypothetical protein KIH89_000505, partial [Candidatus Shapirobacteria bacterium]|nr:hypothetical protein [Candidatus Shapirobacteria bacterium]
MHYLLLLPFFANVIVAIFIFGKNPRNTTHCFFALISLCLGLWSFTLFLRTYFLENIFFYKIVFITPFILPTLFLHFSYIFPRKIKYSPLWRRVYWLTGTVIFLMWPWSVQYVDQFGHRKDGLITKIFVVYMVVFTLNTIKNFWQQHKEANKIEKNQLKFFLSGFL